MSIINSNFIEPKVEFKYSKSCPNLVIQQNPTFLHSHYDLRTANRPHDCDVLFSVAGEAGPQWECVTMGSGQVSDGLCFL